MSGDFHSYNIVERTLWVWWSSDLENKGYWTASLIKKQNLIQGPSLSKGHWIGDHIISDQIKMGTHEVVLVGDLFETEPDGDRSGYTVNSDTMFLILREQRITKILPNMGLLHRMTRLNLMDNSIQDFPESLCQLTKLVELNLARNHLTQLPESVGKLVNLEMLLLGHNCLSDLPESLAGLRKLTYLNLGSNRLTRIPQALRNCWQLNSLDLSNNFLREGETFPREWAGICSLFLQGCRMGKISESIAELTSLVALVLKNNGLTTLPDMKSMVNLVSLDISKNSLTEIPVNIRKLKNLRRLDVESCQLNQLPDWLGELQHLGTLYVDNNHISELPKSMGTLSELFHLKIHDNKIVEIPKCVAMLPELWEISSDPIKSFPAALYFRKVKITVPEHQGYCREAGCDLCIDQVHFSPSAKDAQSLRVLAARRLGLQGREGLSSGDIPHPCLELIKSAHECTTPGCSGVFVKGTGMEAVVYCTTVSPHHFFPFSFMTCHPLCCPNYPKNRKWRRKRDAVSWDKGSNNNDFLITHVTETFTNYIISTLFSIPSYLDFCPLFIISNSLKYYTHKKNENNTHTQLW